MKSSFWFVLLMWSGMTAIMMTPVVWPWLRALRRLGVTPTPHPLTVPAFAVGYAVAWVAFSTGLAALQVSLAAFGRMTPLLAHEPALAGGALLFAGAYQLSRLKRACLTHCRSPFGYFASRWRPGVRGALSMGVRHGAYCLGCCGALMALTLVVGMMDVRMMGIMMAVMIVETSTRLGAAVSRPLGAGLLIWGLGLLVL
jgi:predicted metal-binding membrane protein